jgi:hypothetical protein
MHYFLLLEGSRFHEHLQPALAASWRKRSFEPCGVLCAELTPAARRFAETYHVSLDGSSLLYVAAGLPFDRNVWRCIAGELLLYGAAELPEIQTAPVALARLLAPDASVTSVVTREDSAPIQQAHFGSRDIRFGERFYRPDHAGLNDESDVLRLADYLASVNPGAWTTADLAGLAELADEDDRAAELEFVRDCFLALRQLYERARDRNQVVVCETQ